MDEERALAADWLAQLRAVASCSQRERLTEVRLLLIRKRRRSPRQGRLVQEEEEDEAWQDLLVYTQEEDEGSRGLVLAPEVRGQ